ncbi:MAG: hypothetical protein JW869_01095 [Candidatus Omnitrophica bacterium]|nr:hypothetical protein [Candidatus Omnitrophota bacterium]
MQYLFLKGITFLSFFSIAISVLLGLYLHFRPASAIKLQKKFYKKINWLIEPVSMPREIRNTKIMGMLLIFVALAMAVVIIVQTT